MRILFVSESWPPAMNGVATSSSRVVRELRDRGHEVRVLAPVVPQGIAGRDPHGYSLRIGPAPEYTLGLLDRRGADLINQWHPDLVHAASPLALGQQVLALAATAGIPSVAAYLTDFPSFVRQAMRGRPGADGVSTMAAALQRRTHRKASVNVACSRYAMASLYDWRVPRPRFWLRCVDLRRFTPQARAQRLARGRLAHRPLRVGYAGRLAPEKELEVLTALTGLTAPGERVELVLIGDGPSAPRLRELLPQARFTGRLDGPAYPRALSELDVFVHPGRGETLSQVVLEALACGIPCVVPAADTASAEHVEPGRTGAHFAPGDGQSLRVAVADVLADPRTTDPRHTVEIARTVAHRTWPASIASLEDAYAQALGLDDAREATCG